MLNPTKMSTIRTMTLEPMKLFLFIYLFVIYTSDTEEGGIELRTLCVRVNALNHLSYTSLVNQ